MKLQNTRALFIEKMRKPGYKPDGFDRRDTIHLIMDSLEYTDFLSVEHPKRATLSTDELGRLLISEKSPVIDYTPFPEGEDKLPRRGLLTRVMYDDAIADISVNAIRLIPDPAFPDGQRFEEDVCTVREVRNLDAILEALTLFEPQE